jgi:hypothetical protein
MDHAKKSPAPATKTVEQWFAEKKPLPWQHAAAAALYAWPVGKELTADAYAAALSAAACVSIR